MMMNKVANQVISNRRRLFLFTAPIVLLQLVVVV